MAQHHAPRHNGFAVRDFRVKAGLSVDELAQRTLISAPHIRNIENENREPSRLHLHKIADVLACRPTSLVRDPSLLSDDADPFRSSATPPASNGSDDGSAAARANDGKPPTDATSSSERASA